MPQLYLLRHGKISLSLTPRRFIGQTDIALSGEGIELAKQWAEILKQMSIDTVITSPLRRCRLTADIICRESDLKPIVDKRFSEINLGDWEGMEMETIKSTRPDDWEIRGKNMAGFRPSAGESFSDLAHRMNQGLRRQEIISSDKVLIVTHAGVVRTLVCKSRGISLDSLFTVESNPGHMTIINWQKQDTQVIGLNISPNLFLQNNF